MSENSSHGVHMVDNIQQVAITGWALVLQNISVILTVVVLGLQAAYLVYAINEKRKKLRRKSDG